MMRSMAFFVALAWLLALPAAPAAAKGPIHGLVSMGDLRFDLNQQRQPQNRLSEVNTHPGLYAGAVIAATWDRLEPSPGHFDFSQIDLGLANVRAYNAAHPKTPIVAKLRIFAGVHSPNWVKKLDGGPVILRKFQKSAPFPHFWSAPYRAAWRSLQQALAARYDDNPLVAEVAVSSCSSITAEPFIVPLTPLNRPTLVAAGYTDQAMQACLLGAIDDYAPWHHTAIDYTVNPMRVLRLGSRRLDFTVTLQVMQRFRARYGARAVLGNHGLQPDPAPRAIPVLEALKRLGPPIEFQTVRPHEDWDKAVAAGLSIGMTELEIWNTRSDGGFANVSAAQLRAWQKQLEH